MSPPAKGCLRCNGSNWLAYGHWHICRDCDAAFVARVEADVPAPWWTPELFDKGIPDRGGK